MRAQELADRYYGAFRNQTDFSEVPFAEDLAFQGPTGSIEGASAFRESVGGLAKQLRGLEVRHQQCSGDTVMTVYDFDLGLPTGPVPMAEVLVTRNDRIAAIELLFDSRRLGG